MVPLLRDWCPPLILSASILVQRCLHQPSQDSRETRQKALWYCPNNTDKINTLSLINVFVLVMQLWFLDLFAGKTMLLSGTHTKTKCKLLPNTTCLHRLNSAPKPDWLLLPSAGQPHQSFMWAVRKAFCSLLIQRASLCQSCSTPQVNKHTHWGTGMW